MAASNWQFFASKCIISVFWIYLCAVLVTASSPCFGCISVLCCAVLWTYSAWCVHFICASDVTYVMWMYLSCGHNMSVRIFVPVDVYGVDISVCCGCCWLFYVALFSTLEQTNCALVACDSKRVTRFLKIFFMAHFEYPPEWCTDSTVVVTWLVPWETAAVSVHSVYTLQPCTMSRHLC